MLLLPRFARVEGVAELLAIDASFLAVVLVVFVVLGLFAWVTLFLRVFEAFRP